MSTNTKSRYANSVTDEDSKQLLVQKLSQEIEQMPPMHTPAKNEFLSGVKAELPLLLGVVPFGLIFGVLAIAAGLPPLLGLAMSSIVFAGSAQFIGVQLIGAATPAFVLLLTTFVVNIRHMLYSASIAPYTKHLSRPWRWLLAYLLTDEAYVVSILHYEAPPKTVGNKHWFLFGSGITLWIGWNLSTAVGIFFGTQIPASWGLDFSLALTFIGMMIPLLKDRSTILAALSAGIVAVLAINLPYKLGLMAAALTGIAIGMLFDNKKSSTVNPSTGSG